MSALASVLPDAVTHLSMASASAPTLLPDWLDASTMIGNFIDKYGAAAVIGIACIVFIETGLFFPLLPGDSLLFMAGAFVASGHLHINLLELCLIMFGAAFLGDQNAYWIGRAVGPKLFKPDSRIFKKKYIDKTHEYFEKYGGRTIVIARFVPIVRTFSAVSAGVSRMRYRTFISYDALGAFMWGCGVTCLGYLLGNIEFIKDNIEALLVLIVLISVVPMVVEVLRARRRSKVVGVADAAIEALAGEDLIAETSPTYTFDPDDGVPASGPASDAADAQKASGSPTPPAAPAPNAAAPAPNVGTPAPNVGRPAAPDPWP